MFAKIIAFLRAIFTQNQGTQGKGADSSLPVAVSDNMAEAIMRWRAEYTGKASWLSDGARTLNLPAQIAAELATLTALEAEVDVTGDLRADFLKEQLQPVFLNLQKYVEYAAALGGMVLKPTAHDGGVAVDAVLADDFYPTAFNARGEITAAAFVERKIVGSTIYSRVEYHSVTDKGYIVTNRAYRGRTDDDPGVEIPLSHVPEWAGLAPKTELAGIDFPLFAYLKMPLGNFIDPKSPLGVSVFARAESTIEDADRQYSRLLWEYEGGELAIHASEDAFEMDARGRAVLPVGRERLYVPTAFSESDGAGAKDGIFSTFSPALRDASYLNGLNAILQKIEDQCSLARGTLCDKTAERAQIATATEIKMQRQRTYSTVTAMQAATEKALRELLRAADALCDLYDLCPAGNAEMTILWDDSVITDSDTQRERDRQDVRDGLMQKWEYRVKWYGETEEQARMMTDENGLDNDSIMGFAQEPQAEEGA